MSSLIRIKIKSQLFEALRNLIYFLLYTSSNADEDEGIGDDNDEDDDDDDNGDDDDDDDYDEYDNGDDDDDNDARSLLTRFACCYPPPHSLALSHSLTYFLKVKHCNRPEMYYKRDIVFIDKLQILRFWN